MLTSHKGHGGLLRKRSAVLTTLPEAIIYTCVFELTDHSESTTAQKHLLTGC